MRRNDVELEGAAADADNELELALLLKGEQAATSLASASSAMKNDLDLTGEIHSVWRPKNGVASLTVNVESNNAPAAVHPKSRSLSTAQGRPSRWRTPEYWIHSAIVAYFIFYKMVQIPIRLSQESHPNYWIYSKRLSEGWIAGRKVDNTDAQFRSFRNGFPSLIALSSIYLIASYTYSFIARRRATPSSPSSNSFNPYHRIPFLAVASIVIIFILFGTSAFKILFIVYLNYKLVEATGIHPIAPYLIWSFNIAVLFANEIFSGYKYASLFSGLAVLDKQWMSGVGPRWHVSFNFSMLRLVSFGLDWYWARLEASTSSSPKQQATHPDFAFSNYVAYILYPPLYIAGPIISYTSWLEQVKKRPSISWRTITNYAIRFIVCFLTMEFVLHYMYVVAIKDSYAIYRDGNGGETHTRAWEGDTPAELAMISFWNLVVMWLKLLLPWRFFRLWALLDGIDPPENMIRCVLNNYSTRGFWRSWHRSYNLWLIRYLYVPLAKSSSTIVATLVSFTFVALWHDLSLRLLTWGWVITLFVVPEMIASRVLPEKKYGSRPWYRHVCAAAAVFNILMMITANTIGFVLGTEHTLTFLKLVFGTWKGIAFSIQAFITLFSATQLMFEYREEELRHNISRKC